MAKPKIVHIDGQEYYSLSLCTSLELKFLKSFLSQCGVSSSDVISERIGRDNYSLFIDRTLFRSNYTKNLIKKLRADSEEQSSEISKIWRMYYADSGVFRVNDLRQQYTEKCQKIDKLNQTIDDDEKTIHKLIQKNNEIVAIINNGLSKEIEKINSKYQSENEELINKYQSAIIEHEKATTLIIQQNMRLKLLEETYIEHFGKTEIEKVKKMVESLKTCPKCGGSGLGGNCTKCDGIGWVRGVEEKEVEQAILKPV